MHVFEEILAAVGMILVLAIAAILAVLWVGTAPVRHTVASVADWRRHQRHLAARQTIAARGY